MVLLLDPTDTEYSVSLSIRVFPLFNFFIRWRIKHNSHDGSNSQWVYQKPMDIAYGFLYFISFILFNRCRHKFNVDAIPQKIICHVISWILLCPNGYKWEKKLIDINAAAIFTPDRIIPLFFHILMLALWISYLLEFHEWILLF